MIWDVQCSQGSGMLFVLLHDPTQGCDVLTDCFTQGLNSVAQVNESHIDFNSSGT